MANLSNITDFKAEYSQNVLPITALISDSTTVNYTGDLVVKSNLFSFEGAQSLRLNKTMTITSFDSAFDLGSALTFTPDKDGDYFFTFRALDNTAYGDPFPINITLKVFINSVLTYTFLNVFDLGVTLQNNWYTFGQSFTLGEGLETSFSFEVEAPYPGTPNPTLDIYIGGFKCELNDRLLDVPSFYSKPKDYDVSDSKVIISETQWDITDVGEQTVANGASLNLLTLINNATDKNVVNTDSFDELNIVSNSILTTYRNCKTVHLIRLSFNILTGTDQHYQIQIRRTIDDSVVYGALIQRNSDETTQTIEMTTRTLSSTDPYTIDGFYIAFVNNSGVSATIDDNMSLVIISTYQKSQNPT